LRWSEPKPFSPGFWALYALIGAICVVELAILWGAINPDVPPEYRAYYIDGTSTCLPQPVTGEYVLGTEFDLTANTPPTRELRPCGWQGPVGDGLHAVGTSAQLYLAPDDLTPGTYAFAFTARAVNLSNTPSQRVIVSVNETPIGALRLNRDQTGQYSFRIPEPALENATGIRIVFDFPDAVQPGGRSADGQRRSIKLERFVLRRAAD
jgi:hypothetical protein